MRKLGGGVVVSAVALALASAEAGAQNLKSEYWQNTAAVVGSPAVPAVAPHHTGAEAVIDYDDDGASAVPAFPAPLASLDTFVVRWSGFVRGPATGPVTFTTLSDDGVRLRVGGATLISNWDYHAPETDSAPFDMVQGVWYPIELLFFESGYSCRIRLSWSYAGQGDQIIPPTHQAQVPPAPGAPVAGGQAGDLLDTFNTLTWTFAGPAASFTIYRSPTSGALGAPVGTVAGNVFTFVDAGATQYDATSYYSVTATNGVEGPPSAPQVALTPRRPAGRSDDHDEGVFGDNCACGSTGRGPGAAWALLAAALLAGVLVRRPSR
jgi:hypothetical protein